MFICFVWFILRVINIIYSTGVNFLDRTIDFICFHLDIYSLVVLIDENMETFEEMES